jgi:heptosyltransferase-1
MERPIRILILRVGAMGDVLHGLPAVTALKLRHPDWTVGWAIEPRWAPLLSPEVVDSIHPVPTRAWKEHPFSRATLRDLVTLRRALRRQRYDVCVDLQGSIRSAILGRMASAPRFLGSAKPRERQARAFYTERVPLHAESVIQQACELVGAIASEVFTPAKLNIPKDPRAERWFQHTVSQKWPAPSATLASVSSSTPPTSKIRSPNPLPSPLERKQWPAASRNSPQWCATLRW